MDAVTIGSILVIVISIVVLVYFVSKGIYMMNHDHSEDYIKGASPL